VSLTEALFQSVRAGLFVTAVLVVGCGDEFSSDDRGAKGHLVLNEVDYNNADIDTKEFIEIFNASSKEQDLSGIFVILINGEPTVKKEYARYELVGALGAKKYLVLTSAPLALPDGTITQGLYGPSDQIQNGGDAGDAIALFDTKAGSLIDALSYEGEVRDGEIEGFGSFDLVEGTQTPLRDDGDATALARSPNGHDSDDAASDWKLSPPTPGAENP
jgi:hypothetical protein